MTNASTSQKTASDPVVTGSTISNHPEKHVNSELRSPSAPLLDSTGAPNPLLSDSHQLPDVPTANSLLPKPTTDCPTPLANSSAASNPTLRPVSDTPHPPHPVSGDHTAPSVEPSPAVPQKEVAAESAPTSLPTTVPCSSATLPSVTESHIAKPVADIRPDPSTSTINSNTPEVPTHSEHQGAIQPPPELQTQTQASPETTLPAESAQQSVAVKTPADTNKPSIPTDSNVSAPKPTPTSKMPDGPQKANMPKPSHQLPLAKATSPPNPAPVPTLVQEPQPQDLSPAPDPNGKQHVSGSKLLPKTVRNRPENSRVFIGNLASENTTVKEIIDVFEKYGELIEEPVLRRSFGFVQYSSAESARRAVDAEQGRLIGGIGIDLSIADNREVKKGTHVANNTPFSHPLPKQGRQSRRERDVTMTPSDRQRKRRRSLSPVSAAKKGGVHPPQFRRMRPDPKNGIFLRVLCMSPTAKAYARHCEATFRSMTGLSSEVINILATGLGEALGRAMRDTIPYVMVVASKDVEDGTCTIRTLERTGYEKSGRGNGVIPLREAVEVCLIERGVIAPQAAANQPMGPHMGAHHAQGVGMGMGPMGAMNPYGGARGMGGPHSMNGGGPASQWGGGGSGPHVSAPLQRAKPGWMTGPRAPHPANTRMAAPNVGHHGQQPSQTMHQGVGSAGGYAYNAGMENTVPYGPSTPGGPVMTGPSGHRGDQDYGRGHSAQQSNYVPPQNIGSGQNVGGDYGRSGGSMNSASGLNPQAGYMDRFEMNAPPTRGNQYGPRRDTRESEYDPAAVMPSHGRGPEPGFTPINWNRDTNPMNRGEMYGERTQPAITRVENGGFQTIGGGPQIYPGAGGAGSSYNYDRAQNHSAQPPAHPQAQHQQQPYGQMSEGGYDALQNGYAGNAYGQQQQQYGGGALGNPQVGDGDRYANMFSQPQTHHGPPQRYGGGNVGMYGNPGTARSGGWSGGTSHGNTSGMHGGNVMGMAPGSQANSGMHGHNASPNGYPTREAQGPGHEYMGRGGMDARGTETNASGSAGNVLGGMTGAVDISKLTSLISEFQKSQRNQQQQDNSRGGQGLHRAQGYSQQYPDHGARMRGPQQGYYR
eukprot:GFKZ01006451.1.p1 GENE.GFKZ01006451.1~~GFKZ01006451.1.p1  ORF type:complete len:1099 (-),score=115.56 GFKZ01006451.1:882-4178(-)